MSNMQPGEPTARETRRRRNRGGTIVWALILIGVGGWFLLNNLGFDLPNMAQMWPVFVLVPGIFALAGYAFGQDHDPGLAFLGTAATLLGVFFFMTTLGIGGLEPGDMGRLWPVYPLIGGIAFVVLWVASGFRDWGALVPGGIAILVGLLGLGAVMVGEQTRFFELFFKGWPMILIVVGLAILVGYFVNEQRE